MVGKVGSQLFFSRKGLLAVYVASVYALMIINSLDVGVETATASASEGVLAITFVAEVVLAGLGHHPDMDRVIANRADLCLSSQALRVLLNIVDDTLTVVPSKNTTSSS